MPVHFEEALETYEVLSRQVIIFFPFFLILTKLEKILLVVTL